MSELTPGSGREQQLGLAVDLGTGALKVGFVSLTGQVAWQDEIGVETEWLPDGGAVQDAELWWEVIGDAARRGLASGAVSAEQVVIVAITGQWASTVPVDCRGRPVGDCVMWMDKRGGRGEPIGHMLFLERDCPDVARAASWYLEPVDYLTMRFTGVAAASHASMTAARLTDNERLDQMQYDEELVRLSGVEPSKLPPLVPSGSIVGTVHGDVASALGLPCNVPVITGIPDIHSATYGAGAVLDYEPNMAISTTSWISAPVPFNRTDALHGITSIPGTPPSRYLIMNNQDSAGRCYEWLRDVLADGDYRPDYDALTELAAKAPPGSGNVVFTPWLNGERSPFTDRHARGGFHNVSLSTSRNDLVRAVLEGVAYNSRFLLSHVETFAERRLDPIRLIGGGATSDLWTQTLADVMDRTIERVKEPVHAGIRGAAIFAGTALGAVRPDEVRSLVQVDTTFTPDPANRAVYDRLYAEVPRLYKAQKGIFARLNATRAPTP